MKKSNKLLLKKIKDLEKINRKWVDRIAEDHEGLLTADGFDSAILGISEGTNPVIVYSYNQCVHVLCIRYDMTNDDAQEHMQFNVTGAYVGAKTPLFIHEVFE